MRIQIDSMLAQGLWTAYRHRRLSRWAALSSAYIFRVCLLTHKVLVLFSAMSASPRSITPTVPVSDSDNDDSVAPTYCDTEIDTDPDVNLDSQPNFADTVIDVYATVKPGDGCIECGQQVTEKIREIPRPPCDPKASPRESPRDPRG